MARWFRFHADALDNPKVQKLDAETYRNWVNILCLACKHDGKLPPISDIAFALRISEDGALTVVTRLLNATLIDRLSGGPDGWHYAPHGWQERQYISDTSTERVKRFRKRSKPVTETAPDTDTDTDNTLPKGNGENADPDKVFWDGARAYLGKAKASIIGKWCRDYGQDAAAKAITEAQLARAVDPVTYIERVLRRTKAGGLELPIC